jgi:hypothetical protein
MSVRVTKGLLIACAAVLGLSGAAVMAAAPAQAQPGWHEIDDEEDVHFAGVERRIIEHRRVVHEPVVKRTVIIERPVVERVVHHKVVVKQPIYVRHVVRRPVYVRHVVRRPAHVRHVEVFERPWHRRPRCFLPERYLCD